MLKVLIAPTAFKGTLLPKEVAQAIAQGLESSGKQINYTLCPLADGGDGTIESLHFALGGTLYSLEAHGPLSFPVPASWLRLDHVCVVELACASGIAHLKGQVLAPLATHTFGLGEVLKHCLEHGGKNIVITVGGSASTDGGTGALSALGARFYSAQNKELPLGGGALLNLTDIDLRALSQWQANFSVACDVTNSLLGENGAARVFSPQKGASASDVAILESGLLRLADLLEKKTGRAKRDLPGAGAAGGAAFGLSCALDAKIISGFDWISEVIGLEEKIKNCDLVISGEGRLDSQSLSGKATGRLAELCKKYGKSLFVVCAEQESSYDWQLHGITKVLALTQNTRTVDYDDIKCGAQSLLADML